MDVDQRGESRHGTDNHVLQIRFPHMDAVHNVGKAMRERQMSLRGNGFAAGKGQSAEMARYDEVPVKAQNVVLAAILWR